MLRLSLATLVAVGGLVILGIGAPVKPNARVPDLDQPLEWRLEPFAQPSRQKPDIRHTFPDTWREALAIGDTARIHRLTASQGRLVVSPRVGIGPLAVRVLWHVPEGLHGTATLQATQTDIDPPMVVCTTRRQLQGRAETIEATWTLPSGLWDVSGCVAGRCLSQAVVVS